MGRGLRLPCKAVWVHLALDSRAQAKGFSSLQWYRKAQHCCLLYLKFFAKLCEFAQSSQAGGSEQSTLKQASTSKSVRCVHF